MIEADLEPDKTQNEKQCRLENITIDPEFSKICPPMSDDERTNLARNISDDGKIRDPIIVWKDGDNRPVVDGHNRKDIYKEYYKDDDDIPEPTIEVMEFEDRDSVIRWIVRTQLGRRNLTDIQRIELALLLEPELKREAKERQKDGGNKSVVGVTKSSQPQKVRTQLAKTAGASEDSVRKAQKILDEGSPELIDEVRTGKKSLNGGFNELDSVKNKKKPEFNIDKEETRLMDTVRKALDRWPDDEIKRAKHWVTQVLKEYPQHAGGDGDA